MQAVSAVVGARPFGIALVAGGIASFGLKAPLTEAVRIGAASALAGGIADAVLSSMGYATALEAYSYGSAYIDLEDVVAGAGAMALLEYIVGVPQQPLLYHAAVAGLACGVGPKLTTMLLAKMQSSPVPDSGQVTGSTQVAAASAV